jgi:hypothetical protein
MDQIERRNRGSGGAPESPVVDVALGHPRAAARWGVSWIETAAAGSELRGGRRRPWDGQVRWSPSNASWLAGEGKGIVGGRNDDLANLGCFGFWLGATGRGRRAADVYATRLLLGRPGACLTLTLPFRGNLGDACKGLVSFL